MKKSYMFATISEKILQGLFYLSPVAERSDCAPEKSGTDVSVTAGDYRGSYLLERGLRSARPDCWWEGLFPNSYRGYDSEISVSQKPIFTGQNAETGGVTVPLASEVQRIEPGGKVPRDR